MLTNFKEEVSAAPELLEEEIEMEQMFDESFDPDNPEDESYDEKVEYLPSQAAALSSFSKAFHKNSLDIAVKYLTLFFSDKDYYQGGRIPKDLVLNDKNVSMVLNFDVISGVETAYAALAKYPQYQVYDKEDEVTEDIKLVNSVLELLSYSKVPQQFAGGMLCLYLKLVEGIEFDF